ncbi:AraC family transcriptional regulator [Gordonia caeni]|uniref:AraC family transcriptional regulator n=1 Tax=Gordonia caeni TaxID=1007097 RepID=A0ABP7PKU8_9ACTN
MADLISASSLSRFPQLADQLGGDADRLLRGVGIDPAVVGAHDRFVPFTAVSALLGRAAAELRTPDFALRLAAQQHPDILGPIAIAARNATTVGAALQAVTEHAHVYSPALATAVRADGDHTAYEFDIVLRRVPARDHITELALGVTLSTVKMIAGPAFQPVRVTFVHAPIAEREAYLEHFGAPVEFEAPRNTIVVHTELMNHRITQVDPLAHDLAIQLMAGVDRYTSFEDTVAAAIKRSLPVGAAGLPRVAALMAMHPRTLQRRLGTADITFDALVDQVRRDTAGGMLANPNVPLSAIATQLGYSEQSSLTRSCRRWFGRTPKEHRRALVQAAAVARSDPARSTTTDAAGH